MTFLGARPKPGFDLFAAQAGLRRRLRQADVVLTGEGALDRSTLMGKGVGEIAQLCQVEKVPCIGVAGMVTEPASLERRFRLVRVLIHLTTLENAKARPAYWLEQLAARVAGEFAATE
jgi:glycerate kinase